MRCRLNKPSVGRNGNYIPTRMDQANDNQLHWYALKVFYNKVFAVEEELTADGIQSYVPTETTIIERDGQRRHVRRPVVNSLMFFRATRGGALDVQARLAERAILYTRAASDGQRRGAPYAIPDREMDIFMLVTSSGETGLDYFGDAEATFAEGQRVRVTDGPFRGAEGCIKRIHGDRRLLVSIRGICAVATTYIPKAFLKEI